MQGQTSIVRTQPVSIVLAAQPAAPLYHTGRRRTYLAWGYTGRLFMYAAERQRCSAGDYKIYTAGPLWGDMFLTM